MKLFSARQDLTINFILWVVWISVIDAAKSPRPASPSRKYWKLNSYFYEGLINIGDLFESPEGLMMIAVENQELILIPSVCSHWLNPFIHLYTIHLPTPKKARITAGRKVAPDPRFNFDYQKAVAMAKKLQYKLLPHSKHCNKSHWQNYILYGVTHLSPRKGCPLARSLDGVTPQTILSDQFWLTDAGGYYCQLQTPEEYRESLRRDRNLMSNDEYVGCGSHKWRPGKSYPDGSNCFTAR